MAKSLRGHFLIAGCRLRDPNFFKTAVLIVEHNDSGAMGLIVNRPSSLTISNALAGHFDIPDKGQLVYIGGPVEPENLFVLHTQSKLSDGESAVVEGLFVGTTHDAFEPIVKDALDGDPAQFRVFLGCAGWGPQQLEGELARGDWHTLAASSDVVFSEDPYSVWDELLRRVHESHRLLPQITPHPEWN